MCIRDRYCAHSLSLSLSNSLPPLTLQFEFPCGGGGWVVVVLVVVAAVVVGGCAGGGGGGGGR
eukprot:3905889-Prorocentrum_lima.AAC.1